MPPSPEAQSNPTADSTTISGCQPGKPSSTKAEVEHKPEPQLLPQLLARVGAFRKAPAERGLYRELLATAIGRTKTFIVDGYTISAAHVWAVGAAIYFRADAAGVLRDFSTTALARDSHIGERAVRAAMKLYRSWHIIRTSRPGGRRQPSEHRINVGGMSWPAVRKRAALERAEHAQKRLDLHDARPVTMTALAPRPVTMTALRPVTMTAPKGYVPEEREIRTAAATTSAVLGRGAPSDHREQQQPYSNASTTRTTTDGGDDPASDSADGGNSPTAGSTDGRREEKELERQRVRLDGLLAAIAGRSRQLRQPFHETACRKALREGLVTIEQLQDRADELQAALDAAPATARPAGRTASICAPHYRRPGLTEEEQRKFAASGGDPWR